MEPSMPPFDFYSLPEGVRSWITLTVGTDGGKPLVERVGLTERDIIEVKRDVEELSENIKEMKKQQSAYGKSTIFLLLGILATLLTALFNGTPHK